MGKFIQKEKKEIEAISFDEFVEFGLANSENIVDGIPCSFNYKDHIVTNENKECYQIEVVKGNVNYMPFTPNDMLIINEDEDQLIPYDKEKFFSVYDPV